MPFLLQKEQMMQLGAKPIQNLSTMAEVWLIVFVRLTFFSKCITTYGSYETFSHTTWPHIEKKIYILFIHETPQVHYRLALT